jgi:hypothetical protein
VPRAKPLISIIDDDNLTREAIGSLILGADPGGLAHQQDRDGIYVCSFTAAETKNRRELQLALPKKVPETGLGERAAQKVDLLRTAVPAVEQEPPAADIEMAGPKPSEALPNWLMSFPGSVFGGLRSW